MPCRSGSPQGVFRGAAAGTFAEGVGPSCATVTCAGLKKMSATTTTATAPMKFRSRVRMRDLPLSLNNRGHVPEQCGPNRQMAPLSTRTLLVSSGLRSGSHGRGPARYYVDRDVTDGGATL